METLRLELDHEPRQNLESLVLDALFEYAARQQVLSGQPIGEAPARLTLTQALDVLSAQQQRWKEQLGRLVSSLKLPSAGTAQRNARLMLAMLSGAHRFFRHEGSGACRLVAAQHGANDTGRFKLLWTELFSRHLFDWLREQDLFRPDEATIERADLLVESAKAWVQYLAKVLGRQSPSPELLPLQFVSTEGDLSATFERGPIQLQVRGHPQPLLLAHDGKDTEAVMWAPAHLDSLELHLAHLVLHVMMLERTRGRPIARASLLLIPIPACAEPDSASLRMPLRVRHAFDGFIGNANTVRRLQRHATTVIKDSPPCLKHPLLLQGAAGTGKSELARRLARALDIPLIHIPGSDIENVSDIHQAVVKALEDAHQPLETHTDATTGTRTIRYPALLLFLDEIHELGATLNAIPKLIGGDRKLQLSDVRVDATAVSIVAALTSTARLPDEIFHTFRRLEMEPYTPDEVGQFIQHVFQRASLIPPQALLTALAKVARSNPRKASEYARDYITAHRSKPDWHPLTAAGLYQYAEEVWEVDEHGLNTTDYRYMQSLESGSKGLPALQQLLPGLSAEQITQRIEPVLIELGAVRRSPRGRSLTVLGEQMIHRYRNRGH